MPVAVPGHISDSSANQPSGRPCRPAAPEPGAAALAADTLRSAEAIESESRCVVTLAQADFDEAQRDAANVFEDVPLRWIERKLLVQGLGHGFTLEEG